MARIPYGAPGVAAYQSGDMPSQVELLIGDIPAYGASVDLNVGANANFPIYSVVGETGGVMALAKADGSVKAIGVLAVPVVTGAGQTTSARVNTSGHLNMNALNWDASFDTDAKKVAAFPIGTSNILIGKNPYDPVA
jgi:hypothetical protein